MPKLTQQDYDKLKKELEELESVERPKVAKMLKEAISLGDLSENSAYDEARDKQAHLEGKINEMQATLKNAEIVDKKSTNGKVDIGSVVKIKTQEGSEREFTITGHSGADPAGGKISYDSPIGRALLGHKKGDSVDIELPGGTKKYKVLNVQ